ncbi:caspase family protein [Streptomyces sp. 35G-GA-8]|uniref:caspase family protein n=1 Tax=Streptomyces sp. 35G-GA-8 TaxID=2939434 RepID=UPI00201F2424|nr:caspase family protein [Streptomyces sp. 35G-GA-8]MCL7380917.1 caspase family protein [Streptomyces sp. 35G-GA-8]
MGTVFILLVGINDYAALRPPADPPGPSGAPASLGGCVNDIRAARGWLEGRLGGPPPRILELTDGEATVAAVTDALRSHLGQAGPGDTALFWYAGHGTRFAATERAHLYIEPTGYCQALVCADGILIDKDLGALLDGVASAGAHTVAVLDSCFSGGATRLGEDLVRRSLPHDPSWPAYGDLGPRAAGPRANRPRARDVPAPAEAARHVLLAACRVNQASYEDGHGTDRHGLFTRALLGALRDMGPGATYRQVLAAAGSRVRSATEHQNPVLSPAEPGGIADRVVLGGAADRTLSPHLLLRGPDGWQVDCGSTHGLSSGPDAARGGRDTDFSGTEFSVVDADREGDVVRVRAVEPLRALVTPVGWTPDPVRVYPVAVSALALPPTTVVVDGGDRALLDAIDAAPLLRLADGGPGPRSGQVFKVVVRDDGRARVLRRDGTEATAPLPVHRVPDCLVHLTRWHQLRDLANPASSLASLVDVDVSVWNGERILPDGHGEIRCAYDDGRGPLLSVRIHNRSHDRTLWCVLLDLTDSYASHSALFPGDFIGPGRTGYAFGNAPVHLSLPESRKAEPGAYVRDWLKLIVAEGEFSTVPFRLGPWSADAPPVARDIGEDHVLRLTRPPHAGRDAGPGPGGGRAPGQWYALTVPVRTVVPE